ncbi:DUF6538 domain-containing protein [Methylobacterium oryzihabitans]|uniref:DUF6538 domain-containing protein n=1 Tax=Methylobacterium oryzihabitans TaxID=2499852 RepID=UPI0016523D03|nr:DUF6538 domain-containing protein [Methylobacterium oryzihabitans]
MPDDLRALSGKREEKISLGTKQPEDPKRRHAVALAELEERWANLGSGSTTLSERQAHDMAAPFHAWWISQYRDEPSRQGFWRVDLGDAVAEAPFRLVAAAEPGRCPHPGGDQPRAQASRRWRSGAPSRPTHCSSDVASLSMRVIAASACGPFAAVMQRASLKLGAAARGEPLDDPESKLVRVSDAPTVAIQAPASGVTGIAPFP